MKNLSYSLVGSLACLALTASAAGSGCVGDERDSALARRAQPEILDGAHNGGVAHFYFLPPLVPDPGPQGTFDPTRGPALAVEVCVYDGADCELPLTARFTATGTDPSETIRVVPEDELYIVNWHSSDADLDSALTYRIVVLDQGVELGHADLDVVDNGRELRSVDTQQLVPLREGRTLPIKFRIERPTQAHSIAVDPPAGRVEVGDALQLTAVIYDPLGNPIAGDPDWESSAPAVAVVDSAGVVTVVGPGRAHITARSAGVEGVAAFVARDPNGEVITVPDDVPTIARALAIAAPEATIRVRAGDFTENLVIDQSVTLEGASSGGRTVVSALDPGRPVFEVGDGAHLVVADLDVMGGFPAAIQRPGRGLQGSLFLDGVSVSNAERGVSASSAEVIIANSVFSQLRGNGLTLHNLQHLIWHASLVQHAQGACVYLEAPAGTVYEFNGGQFNDCDSIGVAVVGSPGLDDGVVTFRNSSFQNNGGSGLLLLDVSGASVSPGNVLSGNAHAGIEAFNAPGIVMAFGTVSNNARAFFAVDCTTMQVAQNAIFGNSERFFACQSEFFEPGSCPIPDPPTYYNLGGNAPCELCQVADCMGPAPPPPVPVQ